MRLRTTPAPRWPIAPAWAIGVVAIWALLVIAVRVTDSYRGVATTTCTFKRLTGVPCATCGGLRMIELLAAGHIPAAAAMNPLVFVLIVGGIAWLAVRVGLGRSIALEVPRSERPLSWALAVLVVGANWLYVIRSGR